jgi:hypothetical protein
MGDEVRVLLCTECGAPVNAPAAGGQMSCEYCGASLVIGRPQAGPIDLGAGMDELGMSPEQVERARLKSLRMQMEHYETDGNPYCYIEAPDGLEYISATDELDEDFIPMALSAFRTAVQRCQTSGGRMPDQRKVYWLARKLKNSWTRRNEAVRARAVIETAHGVVSDPGYRQLLTCTLADLSRHGEDVSGSLRWLEQCDPRPPQLDLDTEYRTSLAMTHLVRGAYQEALDLVGERYGQVPYEPSSIAVVNSIRVSALEGLGRQEEAEQAFEPFIDELPGGFLENMYEGSQPWAPAARALARYRTRKAMRDAVPSDLDLDDGIADSAPEVHVPDKVGEWIFGIIAVPLFIGGLALYDGYTDKVKSDAMATWESVTGVITATGVNAETSDDDTTFYPDVRYSFEVNGRQYRGDFIGLDVPGYESSIGAQSFADGLRGEADAVTVYYDPADPSDCALITTPDTFAPYEMLIGVGLLIVALGIFVYYLVRLVVHHAALRRAALR